MKRVGIQVEVVTLRHRTIYSLNFTAEERNYIHHNMEPTYESPRTINIPLYLDEDAGAFHLKKTPGQQQHQHVIDDLCAGLELHADITDVVHGRLSPIEAPASLIIITFRFYGSNMTQRFHQAEITVRFTDEMKHLDFDPEVIKLWPEGDFTLDKSTTHEENTSGTEIYTTGGPGPVQVGVKASWTKTAKFEMSNRAGLIGSKRIEGRNWGQQNAVRFHLFENTTQKTGIASELRTAVLLKRLNDTNRFKADVTIKATADIGYGFQTLVRKFMGRSPEVDPVTFNPQLEPTRKDINVDQLSNLNLKDLGEIRTTREVL
jgi:hypothetical protein